MGDHYKQQWLSERRLARRLEAELKRMKLCLCEYFACRDGKISPAENAVEKYEKLLRELSEKE